MITFSVLLQYLTTFFLREEKLFDVYIFINLLLIQTSDIMFRNSHCGKEETLLHKYLCKTRSFAIISTL